MLKTEKIQQKMSKLGYDERIIGLFLRYYEKLSSGDRGIIRESEILPVEYGSVEKFCDIPKVADTQNKTAVIKLNGGLGTSMGMDFPKSFVEVREGKRFIDLAAENSSERTPLIFMNSAATREMTDKFITENPQIKHGNIAPAFLQHSFPKILKDTLGLAEFPQNSACEFNPAGHGDVYMALNLSGILGELLKENFDFAFISNIDNTGAVFDPSIADYMAKNGISFLMEVCRRGEMDKKGGHIAKTREERYILREKAQVNESEIAEFEDINKYSYFNTNSVWVDLRKLNEYLEKNAGIIELPFIANEKTLDPNNKNTPKVYQIEQAMGAAISLFDNARILEVEKERFFPVKTNNDLFLLRSDRFYLDGAKVKSFDDNKSQCNVVLNPEFYGNLADFEKRLKNGAPKIQKCTKLLVKSDVYFDKEMEFTGEVEL
ncbi:MAG: UTP--glucose-1-phosphate uridylyltransferase [Chitinivibrionia bacterium]|nr:UTP--glucose-1-phosphate uridylyltransferase [Chitinivibrionia bacterium]